MKARSLLLLLASYAAGTAGQLFARDTHELLNAALWMQTAPEYTVSCRVVYTSAQKQVDAALADTKRTAAIEQEQLGGYENYPAAIIMDLDETVFDNSRFEAQMAFQRSAYDTTLWNDWVALRSAGAVPGALEFIKYVADKKNVEIFYVTNRSAGAPATATAPAAPNQKPDTMLNLNALMDPSWKLAVTEDHILMKDENGWSSDKTERRKLLAQKYRILLLVGDDLGDFVSGAKDIISKRQKLAADNAARWGVSWFLLPNPLYGSWEAATYDNDRNFSDDRALQRKWSKLAGFPPAPASAAVLTQSKPTAVLIRATVPPQPPKEIDRQLLTVPTDYP